MKKESKKTSLLLINILIPHLVLILFLSCSKEGAKNKNAQKNHYISEGEFVLRENTVKIPPNIEDYEHDVGFGEMTNLKKKQKELKTIQELLQNCQGQICDDYKILEQKTQNEISSKITNGELSISTYVDTIDNSSSYCTFDNYTPDTYDPLKVFNIKFFFPRRSAPHSPGTFEEGESGAGSNWPKVSDFIYLFINRRNQMMAQNMANPYMPETEVIQTRMRWRSIGHEIVTISDDELEKYYFHAPRSNGYTTQNNSNLLSRFAQSTSHISTTIVAQNGALKFYEGNLKNNNGEFNILPNGHYELEIHPYFHIITSSYVAKILHHGSPAHVVKINGWFGNFMKHKVWEKTNPETNEFKESAVLPEWMWPGNFNHEMGHNLGLNHTFYTSSQKIINPVDLSTTIYYTCEDMPIKDSSPWCGSHYNNNVMDYNCAQNSFSPCQLKVMHWNAMKSTLEDALYKPGCADHKYDVIIPENLGDVHWDAPHHVIGDIIVKNGSRLIIHCQGSTLASNGQIYLEGNAQVEGEENLIRREADDTCNQ